MATLKVVNMKGEEVGSIELLDSIFSANINEAVLHAATRAYLLNQRQGTQSTLTRTEVSGGGKKPWRQKGTGRARQGSTRAPQWTHGGIAFGPKPRSYRTELTKKTKRVALYSALSDKVANNNLVVVDKIESESYSTKTMANMLKALGAEKKTLVVLPAVDHVLVKSFANIPGVKTTVYNNINVYDVLNADKFIVTESAVKMLQEVYA